MTPIPSADLLEARELFERAGLVLPTVPTFLVNAFHRIGDWLYGSRDVDFWKMYSFWEYPLEAMVSEPPRDYVAIGHVGHGINSYAIAYQLVYGQIACFVQSAWGGVYMDSTAATAIARQKLEKCSELAKLAESGSYAGPRLIVMDGDFSGITLCEPLPSRLDAIQAKAWIEDRRESCSDPLSTAIQLLST